MNTFKEITPEELTDNAFHLINKDWMLVAAEKNGKTNMMTASWGGIGVLWGKPVAFIFIRPQRYTKEFIDRADGLSISVFDESHRRMMNYFGSVSGRDEDKIAKAGLTVLRDGERTYFAEAKYTFLCRKLYAQEFRKDCFIDKASDEKWYADGDYHTMYIVEIEKILVQE